MSIDSTKSRVVHEGDGSACDFGFSFRIWRPEELRVILESGSDPEDVTPTVKISLSQGGGTVHFQTPPSRGSRIAILRSMPFTQTDEYAQCSRFDPASLENRLDRDCAERQQLLEAVNRAVKMPATSEMNPEEYQREYFSAIAREREAAIATLGSLGENVRALVALERESAQKAAEAATNSERESRAALASTQGLLANEIAQALRQALNAASSAKMFAADVEGAVLDAAEKAAACISTRLEGYARLAQLHAASAAQSSCQAAANGEKTWQMVRQMTRKAGEEAAACVLTQCHHNARISAANASVTAANAAAAAGYLLDMEAIIHAKALEASERAAGEVADCLENICMSSAESCLFHAQATASNAQVCAAIADSMQNSIKAYAKEAAKDAALEVAECCEKICAQYVELAGKHALAAAGSVKMALGYARQAEQTDVCEEAAIRRARDEELEERIEKLEESATDGEFLRDLEKRIRLLEENWIFTLEP